MALELEQLTQSIQQGANAPIMAAEVTTSPATTAAQIGAQQESTEAQLGATRMQVDAQQDIARRRFVGDMITTAAATAVSGFETYAEYKKAEDWGGVLDAMKAEARAQENKLATVVGDTGEAAKQAQLQAKDVTKKASKSKGPSLGAKAATYGLGVAGGAAAGAVAGSVVPVIGTAIGAIVGGALGAAGAGTADLLEHESRKDEE